MQNYTFMLEGKLYTYKLYSKEKGKPLEIGNVFSDNSLDAIIQIINDIDIKKAYKIEFYVFENEKIFLVGEYHSRKKVVLDLVKELYPNSRITIEKDRIIVEGETFKYKDYDEEVVVYK